METSIGTPMRTEGANRLILWSGWWWRRRPFHVFLHAHTHISGIFSHSEKFTAV